MRRTSQQWQRLWVFPLLTHQAHAQAEAPIAWEPYYLCDLEPWNDVLAFLTLTIAFGVVFGSLAGWSRVIQSRKRTAGESDAEAIIELRIKGYE